MDFTPKIKILAWNARGLNEKEKRLAVRQTVLLEKPDIVSFQETKLNTMNETLLQQSVGKRLKGHIELEASGTKGGILLAWNERKFSMIDYVNRTYSISVKLKHKGERFLITAVYGPTNTALRGDFFQELQEIKPTDDTPWLVCSDFNVTLMQSDRTNLNNNNWRESLKFGDLLLELELINLPLRGRNFTWTNARETPTMARPDRFLISTSWNTTFPNSIQEALANTSSNHTLLIYQVDTRFKQTVFFRFENAWLKSKNFNEFVRKT